ncbi:MAG: alpha/beta hydrolase [Pseudomonadota bacterium]
MPLPYDYSALDHPRVLPVLFHPRRDYGEPTPKASALDLMIPAGDRISIGACFHIRDTRSPCILFFHGNGEIVSDYDEFGELYNSVGLNLLVVDYRGYGRSTGNPSVSNMMRDCHDIFNFTHRFLEEKGCPGPLIVMGRSIGSASALELAASYPDRMNGLIIESGFAHAAPLIKLLGIDPDSIGFREKKGFGNVDKIRKWTGPTLIIHGELDHMIPFSDGRTLFDACGSSDKRLLKIPGAGHNDLFIREMSMYMEGVKTMADRISQGH